LPGLVHEPAHHFRRSLIRRPPSAIDSAALN
jgi:hypothetical protein